MSDKKIVKEYTNGEVTIVWKPDLCFHSKNCIHGLPEVFDFDARPWIKAEGASTDAIIEQIRHCPSGALSYYMNEDGKPKKEDMKIEDEQIVEVTPNGPLMVFGNIVVKDSAGNKTKKNRVTAFCRCGASQNKPYCDGSHKKINFEG